jgi:hypothetical protein
LRLRPNALHLTALSVFRIKRDPAKLLGGAPPGQLKR